MSWPEGSVSIQELLGGLLRMKTQTRDKDIVGTYLRVCTLQSLVRDIAVEVTFLAEEQKQVLRHMNRELRY